MVNIKVLRKNECLSFANGDRVHKLIIGDNYDALQQLRLTYKSKIEVIYIDPPYGKDIGGSFAKTSYNNSISRDDLISMLYPRLVLAKELLIDNGVIMCSIDDKNQAYVKCLFDKVFGEKSCAAVLTIETSAVSGLRRVSAMQGSVVKTAEYCLIYVNGKNTRVMRNLKYDYLRGFDKHYLKFYSRDKNRIDNFLNIIKNTPDIVAEFVNHGLTISLQNLGILIELSQKTKSWLYSSEIASSLFRTGDKLQGKRWDSLSFEPNTIETVDNKKVANIDGVYYEVFLYKDRIGPCDDYFHSFGERQVRGNLWKGFSLDGGNLNKEGGVSFKGGKKPLRLIEQLLSSVEFNNHGIILDFFAGSGTTGEAVYNLNKKDNGNRRFILCTNNEITSDYKNGIAVDVTLKRMKNTILNDSLEVFDIKPVAKSDDTSDLNIQSTTFDISELYSKSDCDSMWQYLRSL